MNLRQIAMSSALVMLANIGIAQAADMSSPSDATSGNPGGTAAAGEASTNAPNTAPDDPIVKGREEKRQAKEQYKQEKKAAKKDYKDAKKAANQEMNEEMKTSGPGDPDPIVKGREEKRQAKEQYKQEKKATKKDYKDAKKAANQEMNEEMKASGKEEESR